MHKIIKLTLHKYPAIPDTLQNASSGAPVDEWPLRRGQHSQLQEIPFIYSGLSVLRDGSAIGPAEFFRVIGPATY